MEIREYTTYNETESLKLYASVGWTAYTEHPDVLRKGFENSMLTLAAYDGEQLMGIIRAVGDGYTIVFVQDILVFPEHQRKGIGGYVLEMVIENIYHEFGIRPIALGVHKDNHEAARFYLKHGFRKTDVMEGNDFYFLRYPER